MHTEDKQYLIPIVVGILADTEVDLGDEILSKFITSQLVKLKNTFPNSPFLILTAEEMSDDSALSELVKRELSADVLYVEQSEGAMEIPLEFKVAFQSQILLLVYDKTNTAKNKNISKAAELRLDGSLSNLFHDSAKMEPVLDAPDFGLNIFINPNSYQIETVLTPAEDDAEQTQAELIVKGGIVSQLVTRLNERFREIVVRINGTFNSFYESYISFPEEIHGNVLAVTPFLEITEKIEGFNRDVRKYLIAHGESSMLKSKGYLLQDEIDNEGLVDNKGLGKILSVYSAADALSQYYQKKTNRAINLIYAFFFIAVVLYGIIDVNYYLVFFYIALIPAIALLVYKSAVDQVEDRFLDYRAMSEGLRVLYFWTFYGIEEKVSHNYLSKYAGLVSWISRAIKNIETRSSYFDDGNSVKKEEAIRIIKNLWINSQLEYFTKKRGPLFIRSQQFGTVVFLSFVLTLIVVLFLGIYILFQGIGNDIAITRFEVALGAIAAIGVAAQAYKSKKAYDEVERRYNLTQQIYSSANAELEKGNYPPEQVLIFVGKEALLENSDWLWTHRNLPLEVPKG